jgi:hypothetical protein
MSQNEIELKIGHWHIEFMMNRNIWTNDMKKKQNLNYCALGLAALAVGLASTAQATISYQISNGGLETANVTFDGTSYNGILAGGIGITSTGGSGGPSSYVSLCTDFMGSLYLGNTYTYNSPVSISSSGLTGIAPVWGADNSGKSAGSADLTSATYGLDNAAQLFYNNISVLTSGTTDQKAALQLAVWTALYDTTSVGAVTGSRFGFNVASAAGSLAATLIGELVNPTSSSYVAPPVGLLVPSPATAANGNNPDGAPPQELLVALPTPTPVPPTPVPEASTVITGALLLLSFGVCSLKSFGKSRI